MFSKGMISQQKISSIFPKETIIHTIHEFSFKSFYCLIFVEGFAAH